MPQEQSNLFNEHPILNSPYECPRRHWELVNGIPTQRIKEYRREADFITPIPSPKKSKGGKAYIQDNFDFISKNTEISNKISTGQQYHLSIINRIRNSVSEWRKLPSSQWKVTSTTEKLLKYWRTHEFSSYRPFFCQLEAAETAIWLVEVAAAGRTKEHREIVEYLEKANNDCNPGLSRIALKLAISKM